MQAKYSAHEPNLTEAWSAAAAVFCGHAKYRLKRLLRRAHAATPDIAPGLRGLLRDGFAVIPGYYNMERCAFLRSEIDRIIHEQPDALQKDTLGADCRIFGAEIASSAIAAFHNDEFCRRVGEVYCRGALTNFSTLAARLTARPGNLGSGQGWHRDAFHFQYKALIYLSDVGMENGPFQILPRSHHGYSVVRDTLVGRLDRPPASRVSDQQMDRLLARNPARVQPLPAAAGTLILFNSSTIHRGMPIQSGARYALTNYYYPPRSVTAEMRRHFAPFARG